MIDVARYTLIMHFWWFLEATAFIHHNMDKLSRIYPAGSRTDSSNYNPVPLWNAGCQIGAKPLQCPDAFQKACL